MHGWSCQSQPQVQNNVTWQSATRKTFCEEKFKLNTAVRYHLPGKWNKKKLDDLTVLKIYVNEQDSFVARNLNVFTNYVLSFHSAAAVDKWRNSCNMTFYQNQLNFAVWCASSNCGVSVEHLNTSHNLLSSVYKFHICILLSSKNSTTNVLSSSRRIVIPVSYTHLTLPTIYSV